MHVRTAAAGAAAVLLGATLLAGCGDDMEMEPTMESTMDDMMEEDG